VPHRLAIDQFDMVPVVTLAERSQQIGWEAPRNGSDQTDTNTAIPATPDRGNIDNADRELSTPAF